MHAPQCINFHAHALLFSWLSVQVGKNCVQWWKRRLGERNGIFSAAACSDMTDKVFAEPPMDPRASGRRLEKDHPESRTDDSVSVH
jgi:hypothetical protein